MKRLTIIGLLFALAACSRGGETADVHPSAAPQPGGVIEMPAAFLRPLTQRDSVLVGDQLFYGVLLEDVTEGTRFVLPDISKGLRDSVDVLSPWMIDTVAHRRYGKNHPVVDIEVKTCIAGFEEGRFDLPALSLARVLPDGQTDTLLFAGQTLDVRTLPVDIETFQPHDIKPQIRYPVTVRELLPYAGGIWGIALVVILVWIILSLRKRSEEQRLEKLEPAHIVALRKLDKLRGSKLWAPDKQKQFYSGVTDALREYMARRYDFGAMEMTTADILKALRGTDVPKYLYTDMKGLFERSDFVKFAKLTVSDEENAKVIPSAVRFVTETYQREIDEEAGEGAAPEPAEQPAVPSPESDDDHSAYMPKM